MAANDLPLIPAGTRLTNDQIVAAINELRNAAHGDNVPRRADGTAAPRAGSVGTGANPYREVHADLFFRDGKLLEVDPADIPRHNVLVEGVVDGPEVPGLPGTCGHLRYSTDGSYAYIAAPTIVEIDGEQHSVGYVAQDAVPLASRITTQLGVSNTPLNEWWDVGPIWGWGYDRLGNHAAMAQGVFIFADGDNTIYQTNILAPSVVLQSHLPSANVAANTFCYVSTVKRWFRRSGGSWIDSGAAFVGAVEFDSGRPIRLYSARTRRYRNAVADIPQASGVFGQTFINAFSLGNWTAYENGGHIIPVGIANGQQTFYQSVTATDPRLDGRGTAVTAQPTPLPASDFLIAGEQVYGWHAYVPPATRGPHLVRIAPQANLPIIPSLGGLRGVHAYHAARVILTAHSYSATQGLSGVGNFRDQPGGSRRSSCFVPGYHGYYSPEPNTGVQRLIAYAKLAGLNDYPNPFWREGDFGPEGYSVANPELQAYARLRSLLGAN